MNQLDTDNKGNIVIFNEDNDYGVPFLLEEFIDNSLGRLKANIKICQDTYKKNLLIPLAEEYENGELDLEWIKRTRVDKCSNRGFDNVGYQYICGI